MKFLEIYFYYDKLTEKISLDWYICEDVWFSGIKSPKWRKNKNSNRWKYFTIKAYVLGINLSINIKLKKVGLSMYGRDMSHIYLEDR